MRQPAPTATDQRAALAFMDLLRRATSSVSDPWFLLPYYGDNPSVTRVTYRERVYCCELYHQIRKLSEHSDEFADYVLSGELDKSGLRAVTAGRQAPDFVWHKPGLPRNAVVIEVKRASPLEVDDLCKDLQTLSDFLIRQPHFEISVAA